MRVAKWGNSLAVRLPAEAVEALGLKEGDEVRIGVGRAPSEFDLERLPTRDEQLARLRRLFAEHPLPPGFKFNREEANER